MTKPVKVTPIWVIEIAREEEKRLKKTGYTYLDNGENLEVPFGAKESAEMFAKEWNKGIYPLHDPKPEEPDYLEREPRSVLQDWVMRLPFMQQSVLIAAMRGPDGVEKMHKSKMLCRWLRRCIVISAFDRKALNNPLDFNGGSYTGLSCVAIQGSPWETPMDDVVENYLRSIDDLPHHFHLHFLHAIEILGYKHANERIRTWWHKTYLRFVHDMHLSPELEEEMDHRLNDNEARWRKDETRFKT